jgi:hypothetical protein
MLLLFVLKEVEPFFTRAGTPTSPVDARYQRNSWNNLWAFVLKENMNYRELTI